MAPRHWTGVLEEGGLDLLRGSAKPSPVEPISKEEKEQLGMKGLGSC